MDESLVTLEDFYSVARILRVAEARWPDYCVHSLGLSEWDASKFEVSGVYPEGVEFIRHEGYENGGDWHELLPVKVILATDEAFVLRVEEQRAREAEVLRKKQEEQRKADTERRKREAEYIVQREKAELVRLKNKYEAAGNEA